MIDLILNPPILGAILITMLASFVILFYLTKDRAISSVFQKLIVNIFLLIISGVGIFPFSHLNLSSLGSHEKGLLSGALLLTIYAAVLILLRVRMSQIVTNIIILFQQKYLGIYLGLIIFSSFWSKTPLLTLRAAIALTLISGFAVYFARKCNWQQIFKILRFNQMIIVFFSVFLGIFFPSLIQNEKGWGGAMGHPIDLGNMMALTSSLWLLNAIQNPKYRWPSLGVGVLSIIIMQLANSAGAFVIFLSLTVIVFIPSLFRKLNFFQAYILFTFILLIFAIPSIWLISNFDSTLSLLNKDVTFTGRVPLWNFLIKNNIQERLWFGYGYSGFWQPWQGSDNPADSIFRLVGDWAVHAHNGFLDIILSVGLIGFMVFALSFIFNISRTIKLIISPRSPESILPLIILTYVFMSNLSHSPIIIPGYVWFLYVLTTVRLQIDVTKQLRNHRLRRVPRSPKYHN